MFLPTHKGLESISKSWSLLNYHKNGYLDTKIYVQNEHIDFFGEKYIINGTHELVNKGTDELAGSSYVWSDLQVQKLG